jgi:hypothetical protein
MNKFYKWFCCMMAILTSLEESIQNAMEGLHIVNFFKYISKWLNKNKSKVFFFKPYMFISSMFKSPDNCIFTNPLPRLKNTLHNLIATNFSVVVSKLFSDIVFKWFVDTNIKNLKLTCFTWW